MAEASLVRDQTEKPKRVWTITSFFVPCVLSAIALYNFRNNSFVETTYSAVPFAAKELAYFPVTKGACVFISDAAVGASREAALMLAKKGIHVLAGVKTEAEKKSFLFDSRKGLEPIIFDFFDPNTLLAVVYRIKQIRFDLDRKFMGSVINLADYMESILITEKERIGADIDHFDSSYRLFVKYPVQLIQATISILSDPENSHGIEESKRIIEENNLQDKTAKEIANEKKIFGSGGRIILLKSSNFEKIVPGCGLRCVHQATMSNLVNQMAVDLASKNVSVSTILLDFDSINFDDEILEKEFKPIERIDIYRKNKNKAPKKVLKKREEEDAKHERDRILKDRYNSVIKEAGKNVKWDFEIEIENANEGKHENINENENKNIKIKEYVSKSEEHSRTTNRALAVTHSLLSTHPQSLYK